jgi:CRISPR-associated exonuclease Cas4
VAWLPLIAAGLAALGLWLWLRGWLARRQAGLPAGRVVYADTGAWDRCERPLFSDRYRLTGRPDYLVRSGQNVIPVEIKSGAAPAQPYPAHILQLAAYCLLVEEQEGRLPPYGIIKYDDRAFALDYGHALRARLIETLDNIRGDLQSRDVDRSHDEAGRCRGCGYRGRCNRRLA